MILLSETEFRNKKTSDTVVVYGSGGSVNELTTDDKQRLGEFDSFSFNWFCKFKMPVTFFMIREQANIPSRIGPGETPDILFETLGQPPFHKTCFVVQDLTSHSPHAFPYHKHTVRLPGSGIILKDLRHGSVADWGKTDVMTQGVYHGKCSLNSALHVVLHLGYEKVIFSGVDLYDSRYFWIDGNKPRHNIKKKGGKSSSVHPIAKTTMALIRDIKKHTSLKMFTYNPKSLLKKAIPTWSWE